MDSCDCGFIGSESVDVSFWVDWKLYDFSKMISSFIISYRAQCTFFSSINMSFVQHDVTFDLKPTHTRRNMCYMWYENSLDFYWSRFNSNFHRSLWTRKLWGFKTIFEVKFVVSSILLLLIESFHLFRAFPFRSALFSFD